MQLQHEKETQQAQHATGTQLREPGRTRGRDREQNHPTGKSTSSTTCSTERESRKSARTGQCQGRSCQTLLEDRRFEAEHSTSRRDLGKNYFFILPLTRQQRNILHQDRLGALLLSTSFALPLLMNSVTSSEINGGSERSSCRRPARRPRPLLSLTRTDGSDCPTAPLMATLSGLLTHTLQGRPGKQGICGGASLLPGNTCAQKGGRCCAEGSRPWGSAQHFPAAEDARLGTSLPDNH